jgi:hypothetical protein
MTVATMIPTEAPRKIPSLLLQALRLPRARQRYWPGVFAITFGALGLVGIAAAAVVLTGSSRLTPAVAGTIGAGILALLGLGIWLVVTSRRLSARLLALLRTAPMVTAKVRDVTVAGRGGIATNVTLDLGFVTPSGAERELLVSWPFDAARPWLYADLRKGAELSVLCDDGPEVAVLTLDYPELATPPPEPAGQPAAAQHDIPGELQAAFAAHAEAAEKEVKPQLSAAALASWYEHIRKEAPDFADMVASHPRRDALAALEAEAIVGALLCGVMARRGWLDRAEADQAGYLLGRRLRDEIRDSGVSLDGLAPSLGVVIDETLCTIVELGRQGSA